MDEETEAQGAEEWASSLSCGSSQISDAPFLSSRPPVWRNMLTLLISKICLEPDWISPSTAAGPGRHRCFSDDGHYPFSGPLGLSCSLLDPGKSLGPPGFGTGGSGLSDPHESTEALAGMASWQGREFS